MICNVPIWEAEAIWSNVEYGGKCIKSGQKFVTIEDYESLLKDYQELIFIVEQLEK